MTNLGCRPSLTGQVAIVTGAGRGIGKALTIALAENGVKVAALARNKEELAATVEQVTRIGGEILPLRLDICEPETAYYVVGKVMRTFGELQILVNNAAILGPLEYLTDVDPDDWSKVIQTNLTSAFQLTQQAVRTMITKRYGRIITLVSGLDRRCIPKFGAYSISKAALIQMTKMFAIELLPFDITVNGLDPGQVETSLYHEMQIALETPDNPTPLKPPRQPEDVVPALLFLASEESGAITGEVESLDYFLEEAANVHGQ